MKLTILSLPFLLAILISACTPKLKIATGAEGGTYYKFGQSLSILKDFKITPISTAGSKINIEMVKNEEVDLAIVQMDILDNQVFIDRNLDKKVLILLPLYKEEVHLVANKKINSVADLKGKKVSIGAKNSGVEETASLILGYFGVPKGSLKIKNYSPANAIKKLQEKKIDAFFMVAGAPISSLASLSSSFGKENHLVNLKGAKAKSMTNQVSQYKTSTLKGNTYSWQKESIKTLTVHSVIIVASSLSSSTVADFVDAIINNRTALSKVHQKWQEVDMSSGGAFTSRTLGMLHPKVRDIIKF